MRRTFRLAALLAAMVALPACAPRSEETERSGDETAGTMGAAITDRDWELVALGDLAEPLGAEGRAPTLHLDTETSQGVGFAGCNHYSAAFVVSGDSLSFEGPVSTRMACEQGMDVEHAYLSALPEVRTYEASDSTLTLVGPEGPIARFHAR